MPPSLFTPPRLPRARLSLCPLSKTSFPITSSPLHGNYAPPRSAAITRAVSSMADKHEFLCIIPDKQGVLGTRMEVRPQHLQNLKPKVEAGFWTFGGAMLESHEASTPPPIKGSVMLAMASSAEEVLAQLRADVYAAEVWDLEKVQIIPFKTAVKAQ